METLVITKQPARPYIISCANRILDEQRRPYVLKIRDLPTEAKPREKLLQAGPDALSLGELLAVVFNVGTKKEGVLEMSGRLLKEYGEKTLLREKDPKKISSILDIPLTKSCQLVACFELGRRFYQNPSGRPEFLRTARQVFDYLRDMRSLDRERLRGLYLDNHYRLVHDEVISVGSLTANLIEAREVFKPAFDHGAVAVILAHNHPSGVAAPSEADIAITKQLVEAGKILGVHLVDHIIIAEQKFTSVPVEY